MKPQASPDTVRSFRNTQRLYDDASLAPESMGCLTCVDRGICGGAHKLAGFFDCNDYCRCTDKATCDLVCRGKSAEYVARLREVGGLDLMKAPRAPTIEVEPLPCMVPFIEHNSARRSALNFPIVAIPLYKLIDLRSGVLRYSDRVSLAKQFGIDPGARLVISGVGRDGNIERFWELANRPELLSQLHQLGVTLITPPNYSVLTDVPRTDNLHAMKRILLCFAEMAQAGLPTALHVNARTERDYSRWAEVITARNEVQCLAVEFATGAGRCSRIDWHVAQLGKLAAEVGRPLRLIVRGGNRVLESLRLSFQVVTMIDTDAFNKTRSRRAAEFTTEGKLLWHRHPTAKGEAIDGLLQHNVATLHSHHTFLERVYADRRHTHSSSIVGSVDYRNRKTL